MRFRVPVKPDPRPAHDLPPDFVPAEVGPNWSALPLPAIILDARGRVAAINDLAEAFLNVSRRSALGLGAAAAVSVGVVATGTRAEANAED
mgnify:CR=1 FL=1